jgi:hypothetical protein
VHEGVQATPREFLLGEQTATRLAFVARSGPARRNEREDRSSADQTAERNAQRRIAPAYRTAALKNLLAAEIAGHGDLIETTPPATW